ncbi:HAD family hydrolase [Collinsella stercoris]|uniref:HAD family hydrolase n=1 Tax=Collinsella stercoris TaxID=147206 RepID=UPI003990E469
MLPSYLSDTNLDSIKLVATDMDLTLLADDKSMPAGVDERIDALTKNGVLFCAASGRPALALRESFPAHHQDMALVADNGASVYLRDELVYRDLIDRDLYHEVLALATATEGSVPVLCAFDDAYVLERDRCHEDVVSIYYRSITYVESFEELDVDSNKISIYFPGWDSKQKNDEVYSPAFASRLYLTCAGNEWLDFMNIGVDKGSGIRHLAQHLGIDLSDIAAFGDTYNDIPMLDIVGHSYVMANAAEHMHDHGKFLAPSNNEAGVLTVIDHIVDAMGAQPEPVAANQAKR